MRVLVCNWKDLRHPAGGGAEVYTHEVLRRWAACGHDVTLFASAAPGAPADERVDGVRIVRRGSRLGVYRAARRFYESEGRGRFDLVIDEVNTRPFGCARYVDDAPVVALAHQVAREIWFTELPWPLAALGRYWLEPRWLRRLADVPTLTVSQSSRRSLERYGLRRVTVVPVGICLPELPSPPAKEERPTVLFVGRLAANKRPQDAIAAFARLRRSLPAARLWMVGTGPLEPRLRRQAPPGVSFFGRVGEARKLELMARAHVLVVTSVREGWGLVVDEAASVGTTTIAYDVPGLRDSVPAASGVLVPPDAAALARELALRLPGLAAAPASAGWRGGAVDWDRVAAELLDSAMAACGHAHVAV